MVGIGTTSAHAENTTPCPCRRVRWWNYLRARGEYVFFTVVYSGHMELPPRTRRIRWSISLSSRGTGTTSAHAENTTVGAITSPQVRNYLRARGEYAATRHPFSNAWELPPRTRRIPVHIAELFTKIGTTSAHAENTSWFSDCTDPQGNYLRARGEYPK